MRFLHSSRYNARWQPSIRESRRDDLYIEIGHHLFLQLRRSDQFLMSLLPKQTGRSSGAT